MGSRHVTRSGQRGIVSDRYQPVGRTGADVGPDLGASADPRTNPHGPRCGGLLPAVDPVMVAFVATASFRALCAGGMDRHTPGTVRTRSTVQPGRSCEYRD